MARAHSVITSDQKGYDQKYQDMPPTCPFPLPPNNRQCSGNHHSLCLLQTTVASNPFPAFSEPACKQVTILCHLYSTSQVTNDAGLGHSVAFLEPTPTVLVECKSISFKHLVI